jgi:hypothetical protein
MSDTISDYISLVLSIAIVLICLTVGILYTSLYSRSSELLDIREKNIIENTLEYDLTINITGADLIAIIYKDELDINYTVINSAGNPVGSFLDVTSLTALDIINRTSQFSKSYIYDLEGLISGITYTER